MHQILRMPLAFVLLALALALHPAAATASEAEPEPPQGLTVDGDPPPPPLAPLGSDAFVAAKMPMKVVYPRPDSETSSTARHRLAYPGLEYKIPLAIQGGAYPFTFEVVSGPSDMQVSNDPREEDYGTLTWIPPTDPQPATTVRVQVTDQEGSTIDVTYSVAVTREHFVFLDPGAPERGDGTIGAPLNAFSDIHRDSSSDTTYAGDILYLRDGRHFLTGPSDSNGNYKVDNQNKPVVWLAYPDEDVVVDASSSVFNVIQGGAASDIFMHGFRMENARADISNSRFFFMAGDSADRATFFDVSFRNLGRGTSGGTDNPGAIVQFKGTDWRDYLAVINCDIEDYSAPLVGSVYTTRHAVIEGNVLGPTSGNPNQGIYAKNANDLWSIRKNRSIYANFPEGAIQMGMGDGSYGPQRVEIAYNLIRVPDLKRAVVTNWNNFVTGENRVWLYRNTIAGFVSTLSGQYTLTIERNVFFTDNDLPDSNGERVVVQENNLVRPTSDLGNLLGAEYQLIGDFRTQYAGSHGHEILSR